MHEPTPDHAEPDDDVEPDDVEPDHPDRAELRRARREFLLDAAIEAEKETGRRERTDEEARHSLWMRLARLIGGWLLLLVGLAAIPLPGPGWLMVLLGLSLLPYRWTENLIRQIRRRVPGIPEDGRIPTRTWVITGAVVAVTTGASIWWGLRPDADGPAKAQPAAAERTADTTTTTPGPQLVVASTAEPARARLSTIYGEVAAKVTAGTSRVVALDDPCAAMRAGQADLVVVPEDDAAACLGQSVDDPAALASQAGVKIFAPVVSDGTTFVIAVRTSAIAVDDEPAEVAVDAVSEQITAGADLSGDPVELAQRLLRDAGVVE